MKDINETKENKTMTTLTQEQIAILKHTETNSNGVYCGDSEDMQVLVSLGLMKSAGKVPWVPDEYFRLTKDWRQRLIDKKIEMV